MKRKLGKKRPPPRELRAAAPQIDKPLVLQGALTVAADGDSGKLPTLDLLAYTGTAIQQPWSYEPVVVDGAGVTVAGAAIPFLLDHDASRIVGHGTVEVLAASGRIKASGTVSGGGPAAEEVVAAAKNGFPWQASIGGVIGKAEYVEAGQSVKVNGRNFSGPVLVVRAIELREISVLALGADAKTSVRVAAGANLGGGEMDPKFKEWLEAKGYGKPEDWTPEQVKKLEAAWKKELETAAAGDNPGGGSPTTTLAAGGAGGVTPPNGDDVVRQINERAAAAVERINQVQAACRVNNVHYPEIEAQALREEWTVERTRCQVLEARLNATTPNVPSGGRSGGGELNARVLEAALCQASDPLYRTPLEKGFQDEELQAAHDRYHGRIGLQELLLEAAWEGGWDGRVFRNSQLKDILKAAFSVVSIPNILSNSANKFLRVGFEAVEAVWRQVAAIGSVKDFKTKTVHTLTGDLTMNPISPTGRIKYGELGEEVYSNKAKTYAKLVGLSREDIINDDLDALTRAPIRLGRGAGLTLNDIFWAKFLDDAAVFTTGNGNLLEGTDYKLTEGVAALSQANLTFRRQTDPDGKPLGLRPRNILTPPELETDSLELMRSVSLNQDGSLTPTRRGSTNVFSGRWQPVSTDYLTDADAWYLLGDPMDLPLIEVVFLDGVETPTVETAQADFDQLGIQIRGYHDFGVEWQEHRAGVKVTGVAAA